MPKPIDFNDAKIVTCLSCTLRECNQASPNCACRPKSLIPTRYYNLKKNWHHTLSGRISSRKSSKKFALKNPDCRKNWLKTDAGRLSIQKSQKKWLNKNPNYFKDYAKIKKDQDINL